VEKGEKVALVGHNGAGKSTLMRVLAGGSFQGGERIVGHNVLLDYFAQDQAQELNGDLTAYEEILADAPYDMVPRLRDLLGAFLFSGDDIHKRVAVLSGGERNRLALAKMLLKPANLLLMDEPTNHLDLFSKEVLLDALRGFPGTVVFVSHDRHFIDGLATRVVEVDGGALTNYFGDYEYFLAKKEGGFQQPGAGSEPRALSPEPTAKEERLRQRDEEKQRQKTDRARQKRLAEMESAIEAEESRQAELEAQLANPAVAGDYTELQRLGAEHAALAARIAALYEEWEQLQAEL
jgi:ATP-binding cassette subfamily F protein 3